MDSINRQQPEENRKNICGKEAIAKMKELAEKAGTCFFCTDIQTGKAFAARPMALQEVDDAGNIFFLSANDSQLNAHIEEDNRVQLLFQGSPHSDMMSIYGTASISRDEQKIAAFWKPIFKTWFTAGQQDPRITVITVAMDEGYYWDNKHGNLVALIKQVAGALTGQTLDDSIEGHLRK